eukprot:gene5289-7061_t
MAATSNLIVVSALACILMVSAAPIKTLYLHRTNVTAESPSNCAKWTLYKQCDPSWGSDRLGTSSNTICSAGCAMSSVAMILRTKGLNFNPGSLNNWLIKNGGYESGDLLVWGSVNKLGVITFQAIENPDLSTLIKGVNACHGIVANVRGGSHWVLLTSYAGNGVFNVNDPGFSTTQYNFSEMLRFAVYH